jgi:sodium/potassium/calcium exchanger 6
LHKHHKNREEHRNYELEQQRDQQQKPAQQPVKTIDYREYSCGEINEMEAKYNSNNHSSSTTSFDRCKFAMTCNDGDGILFPSLFCTTAPTNNTDSTKQGYTSPRNNSLQSLSRILLIVGLSLVLLLLFRLLNSTTDEFFSPGLELFSLHLGLPPRFAGVVSIKYH